MVSVIIPVYNTGEYLSDCIKSVTNQTYENLQIIVVDDGSEKETSDLCNILSSEDSRIEIIHKKNEGVSVARNVGLERAEGDIICFVDSDDTIHPQMIESLVETIEKEGVDIVICDAITKRRGAQDELDSIEEFHNSLIFKTKGINPKILTKIAGSVCRCAYKKKVIGNMGAFFPSGLKFSEDRLFNLMAMGRASKIKYIKRPFYNRLIRKGSACFRFYPDMVDQIVLYRRWLLYTINQYWGQKYLKAYEKQVSGQIKFAITNYTATYSSLSFKDKIEALKQLCNKEELTECLKEAGCNDLRSKLILKGYYNLLFIIGKLTNSIHKLCRKGQYLQ